MSAKFAIRGYPTLKFFPKGEKSVEKVIDYREARSIEAMKVGISNLIFVKMFWLDFCDGTLGTKSGRS